MRRIASVIVFFLVGFLAAAWITQRKPISNVRSVRFIIPDGYVGIIWVIVDPYADPPVVRHGEVTLRVPENGKVLIKSSDIFDNWFRYKFFYENGIILPNAIEFDQKPPPNTVVAWVLGFASSVAEGRETSRWLVGTKEDYEKFKLNLDLWTPPGNWNSKQPGRGDEFQKMRGAAP